MALNTTCLHQNALMLVQRNRTAKKRCGGQLFSKIEFKEAFLLVIPEKMNLHSYRINKKMQQKTANNLNFRCY